MKTDDQKKKKVLSKFMILRWAAFTAILGCMRATGWTPLAERDKLEAIRNGLHTHFQSAALGDSRTSSSKITFGLHPSPPPFQLLMSWVIYCLLWKALLFSNVRSHRLLFKLGFKSHFQPPDIIRFYRNVHLSEDKAMLLGGWERVRGSPRPAFASRARTRLQHKARTGRQVESKYKLQVLCSLAKGWPSLCFDLIVQNIKQAHDPFSGTHKLHLRKKWEQIPLLIYQLFISPPSASYGIFRMVFPPLLCIGWDDTGMTSHSSGVITGSWSCSFGLCIFSIPHRKTITSKSLMNVGSKLNLWFWCDFSEL